MTQRELPSKKDELEGCALPQGHQALRMRSARTVRNTSGNTWVSPEEAAELLDSQASDGQKVIA